MEEIAQLADDFMATLPPNPSVASATVQPEADSHLAQLVSQLALQVSNLTRRLDSQDSTTLQATLPLYQQVHQGLPCLFHFIRHLLLPPHVW